MLLKIFSIILLALLGETCFAEITIETPKQSKLASQLVNATVQVLDSCYGKQVTKKQDTVVFHGDPTGILFGPLFSKQNLPVISIDITKEVSHDNSARRESRIKLQLFAIAANSTTQLREILKKIKYSPWWNHMASILIVNWVIESDHGCSNAFTFLWEAWLINLLNANFLCVNRTNKVLLYTYNPYTNKAPSRWKLEKTFTDHFDHPWSMFVQEYQEGEEFCEGFNFDKTTDLGGYMISSAVQNDGLFWQTKLNKTGTDSFGGLDGSVAQIFFRAMNANVSLTNYENDYEFIGWNDKGEITGIIADVVQGIYDIAPLAYYQESLINQTVTYPHSNSGLGVVTQYRDPLSQLAKMKLVIDSSSRYGLYLVILMTILFLKFFFRQPLASAILDTLRICCNCGLLRAPNTTAARIFFGALFFFQITIIAIYQGRLASLLTHDLYMKNVDTMQDLIDSDHVVHAYNPLAQILTDPVFASRFVGHEDLNCLKYVLRDPSVACVADWDQLIFEVLPSNLHLSDDLIIKMANVYAIREDWPPEQRLNVILGRMIEADILRRIYTANSEKVLSINNFLEFVRINAGPKVMTLSHLTFAFAILGVGLTCAAITFIIEIIIASACQ